MAKATRNDVRSNFGCGSQTPRGSGVHQKLPPGWKPARCTPLLVRSKAGQGKARKGKEARCTPLFIYQYISQEQGKARQSKEARCTPLLVRLLRPKTGAIVPGGS